MPKVSVIIPVYNTAAYVEEAVLSIARQTLRDIEIIIINDGSTDQSLEILRRLAQSEPRIQLHTQSNQGPSVSRNKGLQHATGEFIYFMDSDDFLEPGALALCYRKCTAENLDFVFFDALTVNPNNQFPHLEYFHQPPPADRPLCKGIDWLSFQIATSTYRSPVWMNFIRASYLQQLKLTFIPHILHEDELFSFYLYLHASRVGYINQSLFKRQLRENSFMTQKFAWENVHSYLLTAQEVSSCLKDPSPEVRNVTRSYLRSMLNAVMWKAYLLPFRQKLKLLLQYTQKGFLPYVSCKNIAVMFFKK